MADNSKRTFRKLLSADMIRYAVCDAYRRFPVSVICTVLYTLWLWLEIWTDFDLPWNLQLAVSFSLGLEILVSATVSSWAPMLGWGRRKHKTVQIVFGVLIASDFIYLLLFGDKLSLAGGTGHGATVTAAAVALFFVPSSKRLGEREAWMFSSLQISGLCLAVIVGAILSIAGLAIFGTLDALFGMNVKYVLPTYEVLSAFAVPAMVLISRIPSRQTVVENSGSFTPSAFTLGLTKFVILPLCGIYMLILYAYGVGILATWNLPKGVICWSVTGLVAVVLFAFFQLEALKSADGRILSKIVRIIPVAMFPLLVMMSVSICYRIASYGITPDRLYVLAFNVWAYGAMLYLMRRSGRGINRIAISFAAIFLVVSIIPEFNFTSLSETYIRWKAKAILATRGYRKFPLDRAKFVEALDSMQEKERNELVGKIRYLEDWNNPSRTADIIDFPVRTSRYEIDPIFETSDTVVTVDSYIEVEFEAMNNPVGIPSGCTRVVSVYETSWDTVQLTDSVYMVPAGGFRIPVRFLDYESCASDKELPDTLIELDGNKGVFMPRSMEFRIDKTSPNPEIGYYKINGYIFF